AAAADFWQQLSHDKIGRGGRAAIEALRQAEQKAGYQVQRIVAQRGKHTQDLRFGALVWAAAGFHFDRSSAVTHHRLGVCTRAPFEALRGEGMNCARGEVLIVRQGSGRKGEVGVAIDETRHYDPARRVDLESAARVGKVFQTASGTHFDDDAIAN